MIIAAMSSPRLASRLPVALATLALWALAAGSAAWWALQWGGARRPVDVPVAATAAAAPALDVAAVARALGAQPAPRRRPTPTWPGGWRCRAC
jgi:general secretion pathway protein C